jgi:hypothetical protein
MQKMLSALAPVQQVIYRGGRWQFQIDQRVGWARQCEQGVAIAIRITEKSRSAYWLGQVTLLLAANAYSLDDALQCWQQQWWLWHRYPVDPERSLLEHGILLQLALATLLDQQPDEAVTPSVERRATAALFQEQWG